jgi:hypothetical protein
MKNNLDKGNFQEIIPNTGEGFEKLGMDERFSKQRDSVIRHYTDAYMSLPAENINRSREDARKGVVEFIDTQKFFVPTPEDETAYKDPDFADGALNETVRRWKEDTIRETLSALESMGMIDGIERK